MIKNMISAEIDRDKSSSGFASGGPDTESIRLTHDRKNLGTALSPVTQDSDPMGWADGLCRGLGSPGYAPAILNMTSYPQPSFCGSGTYPRPGG
jgi:hypothetical protein